MEYRTLGQTGLMVSAVGCGTWEIGGREWGAISDAAALHVLQHAAERGVTFFDTADQYGGGRSETLLGQAFGSRPDIVIATKGGAPIDSDGWLGSRGTKPVFNASKEYLPQAVEGSLRRLRRDAIDVWQLHTIPLPEHWDEAFETLERLREQGKICHFGVSVNVPNGLRVLNETGAETIMVPYNLLEPQPARALLPLAQERGVGVIVRTPLASGFLAGRFTAETTFPFGDHRSVWPRERIARDAARAGELKFLARRGRTLAQAAIRFPLTNAAVSAVVVGVMAQSEVDAAVDALSAPPLTPEELDRLRARWQHWQAAAAAGDEAAASVAAAAAR